MHVERHAADLVPALRETVGALFSALEPDFPVWSAVTHSQSLPTTGADHEVILEPLRVNRNDCERCSRVELPNWSPSFSQFFPSHTG